MTDRRRPKRLWGQQPMYVGRTMGDATPGERETRPGSGRAWGNQWYWECHMPECEHEDSPTSTMVNDDAWGILDGADGWPEALRLGLEHMATVHPGYEVRAPRFSLYVTDLFTRSGSSADGISWLGQLGAQSYDWIVVDRPPADDEERVWLAHLSTRLAPAGRMWWWDADAVDGDRIQVDYVLTREAT